ncbi:MAG: hypothetical protein ABW298_07595 [Candidatus Binatia bacterium]|jgi:hypothetical protein
MNRVALDRGRVLRNAAVVGALVGGALACAPKLTPPGESLRVSGTVADVVDPTPTPATQRAASALPTPTPGATEGATQTPLRSYPTLHRLPLGVAVYEACSQQLYVFKKCPGRFLGEAKLAAPGPFVVEIDTQAPEITVFAFRGFLGPEQDQEACAEQTIATTQVGTPLALQLKVGTCSIKLERRYG